jgi:biopolymer transport protein ExbB/TolQ
MLLCFSVNKCGRKLWNHQEQTWGRGWGVVECQENKTKQTEHKGEKEEKNNSQTTKRLERKEMKLLKKMKQRFGEKGNKNIHWMM